MSRYAPQTNSSEILYKMTIAIILRTVIFQEITRGKLLEICITLYLDSCFWNYLRLFETKASTSRSSRPEVFCKKGVLRNFAEFTGKHLCQRLFFNKVAGNEKRIGVTHCPLKRNTHAYIKANFSKAFKIVFFFTRRLTSYYLNPYWSFGNIYQMKEADFTLKIRSLKSTPF